MESNFNRLTDEQKSSVVLAIVLGAAEMWGEECMPAADRGDNTVYNMNEIHDWLESRLF